MLILGLQGSPRKNGNTSILLSAFMDEAKKLGAQTRVIDVEDREIKPCIECLACDETGFCSIKDNMDSINPLLWQADLIILAAPMFFYNVPAKCKALIDRSQTMWARKYRLKIEDPGRKHRLGFMLAVGATRGKNLFEGVNLTAKYYYDAIGAKYAGYLGYREVEHAGDIKKHETAMDDIKEKANELTQPFLDRKKIIYVCRENACRSQMAAAFTRFHGGDKIEALSGGNEPADEINNLMVEAMKEKGIDMAFQKPGTIEKALNNGDVNFAISMGCEVTCPLIPEAEVIEWDFPDPADKSIDFMRKVRDEIEEKVLELIKSL
ncbi:NAD(P)H-dependent oxidoreductase [Spirochaetota bacterium]